MPKVWSYNSRFCYYQGFAVCIRDELGFFSSPLVLLFPSFCITLKSIGTVRFATIDNPCPPNYGPSESVWGSVSLSFRVNGIGLYKGSGGGGRGWVTGFSFLSDLIFVG